ncbi:DinB family protein [Paenibacillus sp. D2_2]|uniref:DinB family protein n=1 Tax=Paenibacillus sp. D2_2 TaxID=3073092 RepID=UPI002816561F|nr:DinB family protein [Paenibacillus sp. D2_2]WMT39634.1 DinB family protein [Paenibacillus sp. D2_2]
MEFQDINQKLKETREELLTTLNDLSRDQLNARRKPDSWSIGQVCQHLIKTEELYVLAIKRGLRSNEDSIIESKPVELLLDRSRKLEAPDIVKPTEEILEREEIIEQLHISRVKFNEFLNTLEDPSVLSRRYFKHPAFQEMLLIEWLESLYLHEQRHIAQMNEIKDGFK